MRAAANIQIEQPTENLAFVIVGNRRVDRVFIRPIELDPGIEAGFLGAHFQPPGRFLKSLNAPCKLIQIKPFAD